MSIWLSEVIFYEDRKGSFLFNLKSEMLLMRTSFTFAECKEQARCSCQVQLPLCDVKLSKCLYEDSSKRREWRGLMTGTAIPTFNVDVLRLQIPF